MKKFLLAAALAALLSCCPPQDPSKIVQRIQDEVVAIVDEDGDTLCGGIWISKDQFLTAGHCVDDAGMGEVEKMSRALLREGETAPPWNPIGGRVAFRTRDDLPTVFRGGTVVQFAGPRELALVRADEWPRHSIAVLRFEPVLAGEELHVVGHPLLKPWSYSHAYVSNPHITFAIRPGEWLQLDVGITNGNSGGGAFDSKGRLVGIAVLASRAGYGTFAWFVPQEAIREFLKQSPKEKP